jgi:hypothetical protein
MKPILYTILILAIIFTIAQIAIYMSSTKTKTQPYRIVASKPDFEIRFYPAATMATISSSAVSYRQLGRSGFGTLARYIFGGNEGKKQIAMTAPVHMAISDSAASMSFVMPDGYTMDNLPAPNDSNVKLKTTSDQYVAAITFGGFASDSDIKKYTDKLDQLLKANSISHFGDFRFLGYNPPYQLFGRKNEVIVNVIWK